MQPSSQSSLFLPPVLPPDYTRSARARLRYHTTLAEFHRSGGHSLNVKPEADGTGEPSTVSTKATPTKGDSASTGQPGEHGPGRSAS